MEYLLDFYEKVMKAKDDDHKTSHTNIINQRLHLISSSIYVLCYFYVWINFNASVYIAILALVVRQSGHYCFEPPCHTEEQKLLGFTTEAKSNLVFVYSFGLLYCYVLEEVYARMFFVVTLVYVIDHMYNLYHRFGIESALLWSVKLLTDPVSDIIAYRYSFCKQKIQ